MVIKLDKNWSILQDVHDAGEALGLQNPDFRCTDLGNQISEWEPLPELKHLQLIYAAQPYFGRELRYFNEAPWWYRVEFDAPADAPRYARLTFTNVDYYCKIWLNGSFVGEHEGYTMPFSFRVDELLNRGGRNVLIVKVWSPWDREILNDRQDRRTYMVIRNAVKGTYEHSDTFVQRDCNPVGIYGSVTLALEPGACFEEDPEITYTLSDDLRSARVTLRAKVENAQAPCRLRLECRDRQTGERVAVAAADVPEGGEAVLGLDAEGIRLWNTWDKGGAWLYDLTATLEQAGEVAARHTEAVGFRKIEMVRDAKVTRFYLNGKAFYVRGTSYFPDLYVSNMCRERYLRDLQAVKAAGFNLLRIHVHVEQPLFYELCTELGLGILQDSEYNWMHPATDEFADRFIRVYTDTVKMLKRYSAMFCWITMNEPGLEDPLGKSSGRAMTVNPGPRLYEAVRALDPSRPIIKGSFCEDDLTSGDSHNYIGSLCGHDGHYADIYGTVEKLNTEYGFDAPPCLFSLRQCPPAYKRLSGIADRLEEIGEYQYRLLKYFTEHYRMQKYAPNSGYVQFLFNDMCPQSFYGVYDWWGLPKRGLDAMLESNQPVGVFLKYSREATDGIYVVSDEPEPLGEVELRYVFTDENGDIVSEGTQALTLAADSLVRAADVRFEAGQYRKLNCALVLTRKGVVLSRNRYEDLFHMPEHVEGHPERISHELGMRLYFA